MSATPPKVPAARAAISAGLLLLGVGFASWVVRIPDAQRRLALSEGELGVTLLGMAVGGLLAFPLSAALIARFGSRRVGLGALFSVGLALAAPPHAPTPFLLALVLLVLGMAGSVMAVSYNTQASEVERQLGRPIMAGVHALFSLGGLIGAGLGGLVAEAGIGGATHLGVAGLAVAVLALATGPFLLESGAEPSSPHEGRAALARPLIFLGVLAFCVLFSEGAVADWSTIYLRDAAGARPAEAAAGYAAFSLMMAAGRFVGDGLTVRLGPARLVRLGGAMAAAGIALAVLHREPWAGVAGFGLVGAGLSSIYPTLVAAAGRTPGAPASSSIALVSSIGYTGFVAGPPLIGMIGEVLTLRAGVAIIGLAGLLIAGLAGVLAAEG